ncbi:hypothetical protein HZS_6575 [Henneguya salminicola]|nr:hypothetical protein HZS_6575 [Henneguya salminicola]
MLSNVTRRNILLNYRAVSAELEVLVYEFSRNGGSFVNQGDFSHISCMAYSLQLSILHGFRQQITKHCLTSKCVVVLDFFCHSKSLQSKDDADCASEISCISNAKCVRLIESDSPSQKWVERDAYELLAKKREKYCYFSRSILMVEA